MDERELVHQLKARNTEAVKVFRDRYQRQICAALRNVLDDAEDITEAFGDVLLKVWDKIGSYEEGTSRGLTPWVRKIAVNHACNILRQRRQQCRGVPRPISLDYLREENDWEPAEPPPAEPEPLVADGPPAVCRAIYRDAMSRLSPRYQDLLELCAADHTPAQIADYLLIHPSLVSVKLNHAAKALRREVSRDPRVQALGVDLPDHTDLLRTLRGLHDRRNVVQQAEEFGDLPISK